jgi:tripartite-type tricarboxylate transporter receptor subunit TctC
LQSQDVKDRLYSQGFEIGTSTPEQFAAYLKADMVKWAKLVKSSGASID